MVKQRRDQIVEMKMPVVHPKPGVKDVYLRARAWEFYPILNWNRVVNTVFTCLPWITNMDFSFNPRTSIFRSCRSRPCGHHDTTREWRVYVICNEYCALGHHTMIGKIIVQ